MGNKGKRKVRRFRFWVFLGFALLLLGVAGIASERFNLLGFTSSGNMLSSLPVLGMDAGEARDNYRQAGTALAQGRADEALALYEKMNGKYPALQPMVLFHQAEAHIKLGSEGKAQDILKKMAETYKDTPFEALALYEKGKSHVRASQPEDAKAAMEAIAGMAPKTNLTLGSHYYLGEIARAQGDNASAAQHWRQYLEGIADGTFSSTAAKGLLELPGPKTGKDHEVIGLALYHAGQNKEAIPHLMKGAFNTVWVELGKAQIRSGQSPAGLKVLEKGLHMTTPEDRYQAGIDAILSTYPSTGAKKAKLQQLLNTNPKSGGDYLLWQLQKMSDGGERLAYGQQLLTKYPKSNWAPETSWEAMWPVYKSGNNAQFLAKADSHLKLYPYSKSAPKVMFWKAKLFSAQGKRDIANSLYQKLADTYPGQYYAFRAKQILANNRSPWATSPGTQYPPAPEQQAVSAAGIAQYSGNDTLEDTMAELIASNSANDVDMLLQTVYSQKPPAPLLGWVHQQKQSYPQSLRVIRDYLDEYRKKGNIIQDANLLKMLYPLPYSDDIQASATRNNLDPFLVQALMRQESYFNPMAVSSSQAMGLMQLLPSTAKGVAEWEKLQGFDTPALFNPKTNIQLGTRYMRYLHDTFNGNSMQAVGGYNGGPGAMGRWSKTLPGLQTDPDLFVESIPYAQSRDYIKEVFSHYWNYKQLYPS